MQKMFAVGAGAIALVAIGVTGYFAFAPLGANSDDLYASCRTTKVSGSAAIGGDFELISETGATVTSAELFTGPSLVYFGFTYCPDVCPLDSGRTAEAIQILRDDGLSVPNVFITIDPERDTPEVLKEFTSYFDDEMIGLTGSPEQISAAALAYKAYYKKNGDDPQDYLMDHSAFTYLVGTDGKLIELYRQSTTAEEMAKSVACYANIG